MIASARDDQAIRRCLGVKGWAICMYAQLKHSRVLSCLFLPGFFFSIALE